MSKEWISIKDSLPESGQEVLIYYYDKFSKRAEIHLLTYFNKGSITYTKIDRSHDKSKAERLISTLFNSEMEVRAGEDGFYIFEWDNTGNTCCRKHIDVITHWMPLPNAPIE